jgi:transcriptional regulator with XRE-family HTH domain
MARPLIPPGRELQELRKRASLSLDRLAKAAGYAGASSIQRYEDPNSAGGSSLPLDVVRRLEQALVGRGEPPIEREEVYALAGVVGGIYEQLVGSSPIVFAGEEFSSLPRLRGVDGANEIERRFLFRTHWLESLATTRVDRLAMIDVAGDSMSPTLLHGDAVVIDRGQDDPRDRFGAIHAMQRGDELLLRRVNPARRPGCFDLVADNPATDAWRDVDPGEIEVVGRVVWISRRL